MINIQVFWSRETPGLTLLFQLRMEKIPVKYFLASMLGCAGEWRAKLLQHVPAN